MSISPQVMPTTPDPSGSRGQNKRARADLSNIDEDSLEDVYRESDARKGLTATTPEPEEDNAGRRASRRAKVARRS